MDKKVNYFSNNFRKKFFSMNTKWNPLRKVISLFNVVKFRFAHTVCAWRALITINEKCVMILIFMILFLLMIFRERGRRDLKAAFASDFVYVMNTK